MNSKETYSNGIQRRADTAALVAGLQGSDQNAAYACLRQLQQESIESGELYQYFDTFADMLSSGNSYLRTRGLLLIVACARWDIDYKIDEVIDACLPHIMDVKPSVSRQFIAVLPELARYKPELKEDIRQALSSADPGQYQDSMAPLVQKDIAKALAAIG